MPQHKKTAVPVALQPLVAALPEEHRKLADTLSYLFEMDRVSVEMLNDLLWSMLKGAFVCVTEENVFVGKGEDRSIGQSVRVWSSGPVSTCVGLVDYAKTKFQMKMVDSIGMQKVMSPMAEEELNTQPTNDTQTPT